VERRSLELHDNRANRIVKWSSEGSRELAHTETTSPPPAIRPVQLEQVVLRDGLQRCIVAAITCANDHITGSNGFATRARSTNYFSSLNRICVACRQAGRHPGIQATRTTWCVGVFPLWTPALHSHLLAFASRLGPVPTTDKVAWVWLWGRIDRQSLALTYTCTESRSGLLCSRHKPPVPVAGPAKGESLLPGSGHGCGHEVEEQ